MRAALAQHGLDALLVFSPSGVRYLSGFTGSNGLLLVLHDSAALLTDARYAMQARQELRGVRTLVVAGSLLSAAAKLHLLGGCRTAGFEDEDVSWRRYRSMRAAFPRIRFRGAGVLLEDLTAVKDEQEIAAIAEAVRISDRVFTELLPLLKPGITELDVAAEIACRHRRHGAERDAFDPIVAAGRRSALPHARASRSVLRAGDPLVMDFGCVVRGYGSDLTRTVAIGRASPRLKRIHRIVHDAQDVALEAVRSGLAARELDAAARQLIIREGYGRFFLHSLGHGLGLRVHERPRIAPLSADVLTEGNVITIEPGIYLPGVAGARIEDNVVVRSGGCEVLTSSPKELIIL